MRPQTNADSGELYECFNCGARTEQLQAAGCPECGGQVRNIASERDL